MKTFALLAAALLLASWSAAAEPAKSSDAAKPKSNPKPDLELCCDDDAKPADPKTAKATEQKSDAAKKDAPKPSAQSDKK
jgi:hypothetical protein